MIEALPTAGVRGATRTLDRVSVVEIKATGVDGRRKLLERQTRKIEDVGHNRGCQPTLKVSIPDVGQRNWRIRRPSTLSDQKVKGVTFIEIVIDRPKPVIEFVNELNALAHLAQKNHGWLFQANSIVLTATS